MTTIETLSPLRRLEWVKRRQAELDAIRRTALFDARLEGQLDSAIIISGLSRKRALAETRHENEIRGRQVRWGRQA